MVRVMNYLISSASYRLLEEEINKIVGNEKNVFRYDLNYITLEELIEEASYFSLFEEKKYIIVKSAENLFNSKNKTGFPKLEKYFLEPNTYTTIIFTSEVKIDEKTNLSKIFKDNNNKIITIKNLTIKEIYAKLEEFFKKDKYIIDSKSLYYIINNSLNNYDLSYNNALKIKLYYQDNKQILYKDVVELASCGLEDNSFKFVEAVIKKDIKLSFKTLNDLLLNKIDVSVLLALLIREYKLMLQVFTLEKENMRKDEMAKTMHLQGWQLDKIIANNYNYREDEIWELLDKIRIADEQTKLGKINQNLAIEMFILAL